MTHTVWQTPEYFISTNTSSCLKSCMMIGVITNPSPSVSTTRASVWRESCMLRCISLSMLTGTAQLEILGGDSWGKRLILDMQWNALENNTGRSSPFLLCSENYPLVVQVLAVPQMPLSPFGCLAWAHPICLHTAQDPFGVSHCHRLARVETEIWVVKAHCMWYDGLLVE